MVESVDASILVGVFLPKLATLGGEKAHVVVVVQHSADTTINVASGRKRNILPPFNLLFLRGLHQKINGMPTTTPIANRGNESEVEVDP